jgi:hypothetical protein
MNDKLLTPKQAAKNIGVSTRTLRRWKSRGVINPVPTPSGKIVYNPNDLKSVKNQKFNPLPPDPNQTTISKDLPVTQTQNQSPPKSINIPRPPLTSPQQTIISKNSSPTPIQVPAPTITQPTPTSTLSQPQPFPSSEEIEPSPINTSELSKPDQKHSTTKQSDSPSQNEPSIKESPDKKQPKRIKKPLINKTAWAYAGVIGILLFLIGGWIILSKVFQNPTSTNSKATYNSNNQETNSQTDGTIGSTTQNQNSTDITQNPPTSEDIIIGNRLRLNPQTPPTLPKAGDQYYNSTTNSMQYFDGTSWVDLNSSTSSLTLQKAYEAGRIIETTKGDLSFIMAESSAGDGDFLIQLVGNNSELIVSGGSDQDLITINDDALYPIDISQSTRITGSLFANKFIDTQSSSYYLDPASITTAASLAGGISLAGGLTFTQNSEVLNNGTDGYLTSSGGFSVGGISTYYFDTDGNINANQITLAGILDANGQIDLGDGGDSVTISANQLNLFSTGNIDLKPSNDSDDYIYFTTASSNPSLFFEGISSTNDPGIRINSSSGEIEYRDEDSSTWVSFDSLGGSSSIFTDASTLIYLTDTSQDFAIGGTTLASPFSVDESANTVRIGQGSGSNATLSLYASDGDTGSLTYTTSDTFSFSGGNVSIGSALNVTGAVTAGSLTDGTATLSSGALSGITNLTTTGTTSFNGVAYTWPGGDGTGGYVLSTNGTGTLSWVAQSGGSGSTGYWYLNSGDGTLFPATTSLDLIIGGTATASATFQVEGTTGNVVADGNLDIEGSLTSGTTNAFNVDASGNIDAGTWTSTAIGVGYGGTGLTSYTVGDLIYANGATSLTALADTATGNVLLSGGVGVAPSWGQVTLGTHTTGNYVSSLAGTTNQITASGSTGDITLSIPSDFRAPGTVNAVSGLYTGATAGTQRIDSSGNLVNIGTTQLNGTTYTWPGGDGTGGYVLSTNGTGTLSWADPLTIGTNYWLDSLGALYPKNSTLDFLLGDTASASAEFAFLNIDPLASGDPTFQIAYDGSNISTFSVDSAGLLGIIPSGGELNLTGNLDISTGSSYQINDVNILSATTLGSSVVTSSLTTVGALNSGSITSGFGNIDIGSSNLDADGTITFAGISDGLVLATSGVLSTAIEGTNYEGPLVFENGLTEATQTVKWGGALTGNTTITQDSAETITFSNTGTGNITFNLTSTGDFDIQNDGTSAFFVRDDGNVGIGTNAPEALLEIQRAQATDAVLVLDADEGDDVADTWFIKSEAADNDLSFVQGVTQQVKFDSNGYITGQRLVDSANSTYYVDPAASGTSINIDGDIISNGAFSITSNATNGNITLNAGSGTLVVGSAGTGKIDSGTIDPPYMINGQKYATFLSGMVGVKEETAGTVNTTSFVPGIGYKYTIDFTRQSKASDIWLFSEVTNLRKNIGKLSVLLSPAGNTRAWYELDTRNYKLNIYTTTPTQVSYRLTAPRFDADTWTNTRDSSSTGFILNNDGNWETNQNGTIIGSTSSLDNMAISLDKNSNFILTTLSGQIIESISTYSNSIIANLRAGLINAQRIVTKDLIVDGQDIASLIVTTIKSAINSGDIVSPLSAESANVIANNTKSISSIKTDLSKQKTSISNLETKVLMQKNNSKILTNNLASQSSRLAYLETIQTNQQDQIDNLNKTKYDIPSSTTNLGNLPNPTIENQGSSIDQNRLILDDLVSNYASISSLIANNQFSAFDNIASASSDLIINSLNIAHLNVDMLSINQMAVIDNNLMMTNNSIQTISNDTLFIQPVGGNINLAQGLMILSPDGNSITIDGDLTINGNLLAKNIDVENDLKVKGAITAGAIKSEFGELLDIRLATSSALAIYQDLESNPSASINASGSATFNRLSLPHSTGIGTLYTGDQNLTISVDDITLESQVFITFSGDYSPATKYWVTTDWRENTFTIHLNYPVASPVDINWMIIN